MSEMMTLAVKKRDSNGKGPGRRLRALGLVPGIYYDASGSNIPFEVQELPLRRVCQKVGESRVFELAIDMGDGEEKKPALVKEIQYHPCKSKMVHVDFYGVDLTKEVRVNVPVVITGKAKGVIMGGTVEVFRDFIEVVCLPLAIPEEIVLDVAPLDVNMSINIADIKLPEGVRTHYDDNYALVGVVLPDDDKSESKTEEAEA